MLSDFRFGFRQLLKTPGFTAVSVLMLGIALGLNSTVFSLVESFVLRPIVPFKATQVVSLFSASAGANPDYRFFSEAEFQALRGARETFTDVAAVKYGQVGIGGAVGMRRSFAIFASENFFALCGAAPEAGRYFNAEESRPNANLPVAVASHALWQRMGGQRDFIGSTVRINHRAFTIIGISPAGFNGLNALVAPEVWLPLGVFGDFVSVWDSSNLNDPKNYALNLVARLPDGLTLPALDRRLPVLARRLTALQPGGVTGERILLARPVSPFGLNRQPTDDSPLAYVTLAFLGMAGCVLLIACLNLANMFLARGTTRTKEVALRRAIGASRGRIVRLLLAEGLLLALAGGAVGLAIATWSDSALLSMVSLFLGSMDLSIGTSVRPDATVLAFTFLLCVAACLLFSLWPAVRAGRSDVVTGLKQVGSESPATDRLGRFLSARNLLVMTQVALSLMLLFSSGLFLRGALLARGSRVGFETRGGLVATLDFTLGRASDAEAKAQTFAALDRARALPGVQSAAVTTIIPYGDHHDTASVTGARPPAGAPAEGAAHEAWMTRCSGDYLATIGLRLVSGRDFTAAEAAGAAASGVAIIDQNLAAQLFPAGGALGRRITYSDWAAHEAEVVGICTPHRQNPNERNEGRAHLFIPLRDSFTFASQTLYLQVRFAATERAPTVAALADLRTALRELDPTLPVTQIALFSDVVDTNIEAWLIRIAAALFAIFGAIALILATIGVYSVKAYAVTRRRREFGIRMALGAGPREILKLILAQGAAQTAVALAAGTLLALAAGRLLGSILYRVSPSDPAVLATCAALLAAAAVLACLIPARRAAKVDPMVTLRSD